jgi:hypothetical protein
MEVFIADKTAAFFSASGAVAKTPCLVKWNCAYSPEQTIAKR